MYVVSDTPRGYTDQAGNFRLYDPDNISSGGLAGSCGCAHTGGNLGNLGGFLPESPTGKAALVAGVAVVAVGAAVLYRKRKGRR